MRVRLVDLSFVTVATKRGGLGELRLSVEGSPSTAGLNWVLIALLATPDRLSLGFEGYAIGVMVVGMIFCEEDTKGCAAT